MASLMVMMYCGMGRPRRRGRRGLVVVVSGWWSGCRVWSFGGDFGDGGSGAGFVDDGLVGGVGGDEGLDGEVVHRSGQAAGDLVDQGDGVVAEQGVGAADELRGGG